MSYVCCPNPDVWCDCTQGFPCDCGKTHIRRDGPTYRQAPKLEHKNTTPNAPQKPRPGKRKHGPVLSMAKLIEVAEREANRRSKL